MFIFSAVVKLLQYPKKKTDKKNDLSIKQNKISLYEEFLSNLYKQHQVCHLIQYDHIYRVFY